MNQRLRQFAEDVDARFLGLGLICGLVLLTIALIWRGTRGETIVLEVEPVANVASIRVYVGGAVASPGLYTLQRGSRVADAIFAAGGTTTDADTTGLGMAAPLRDADQIIVPTRSAPVPEGGTQATAATSNAALNINRASATELEALPGIGPTIASRVVEYRQRNGFFRSVDELEIIQGISPRMVEEIRSLITVGP